VNWNLLSDEGKETLRTIALPISCGYSSTEIATKLGSTPLAVNKALERLREEIRRLA
jgi:biotin operon repressor